MRYQKIEYFVLFEKQKKLILLFFFFFFRERILGFLILNQKFYIFHIKRDIENFLKT